MDSCGGRQAQLHHSSSRYWAEASFRFHAPGRLNLVGYSIGIWVWMGPKAEVWNPEKSLAPSISLAIRHYTDWATPAFALVGRLNCEVLVGCNGVPTKAAFSQNRITKTFPQSSNESRHIHTRRNTEISWPFSRSLITVQSNAITVIDRGDLYQWYSAFFVCVPPHVISLI
jgi:hypothetical protein